MDDVKLTEKVLNQQQRKERLAAKLSRYLEESNISGRELARRLKLNPTSIHLYLQAVSFPGEEARDAIANLFKITPEELEAELNGTPLKSRGKVEELKQDIRLLEQVEFFEIAEAVAERLLLESRSLQQLGHSSSD